MRSLLLPSTALCLACSGDIRLDNGPVSGLDPATSSAPDDGTTGGSPTSAADDTTGDGDGGSTADDGVLLDVGSPDSGGGPPASCMDALGAESTVGCQFYAVDLDQATFFEGEQFAVVVSNVQTSVTAEVIVEEKVAGVWVPVAGPVDVGPLQLHTFPLANKVLTGSGIAPGGSYRISSDTPIIAYQFNPLVMGYWSSDASMLYPSVAWDTITDVVHWGPGTGRGYVTIIAQTDGTTVSVQPTANTAGGGGLPGGVTGGIFNFELDEGDVAQVAVANEGDGLTGTRIESSEPVAVFTGHECAFIPAGVYACDHLEEQLAGLRLWGTEFVAARVPPRRPEDPEPSLWQIYASEDDTTISFEAPAGVTGLPGGPLSLDAGEAVELSVTGTPGDPGDFFVTADKPIAVFDYMTGWENLGQMIGDPAMLQLAPTEQMLSRYVLLVPSEWTHDFLVVSKPQGATIHIDGALVQEAAFADVGGGWQVARIPAEDGVHQLEGSSGFAVAVVGYDTADSYAYLGGVGTDLINPEPAG